MPLAPEPIVKADGDAKNDCERSARAQGLRHVLFAGGKAHRSQAFVPVGRRT